MHFYYSIRSINCAKGIHMRKEVWKLSSSKTAVTVQEFFEALRLNHVDHIEEADEMKLFEPEFYPFADCDRTDILDSLQSSVKNPLIVSVFKPARMSQVLSFLLTRDHRKKPMLQ